MQEDAGRCPSSGAALAGSALSPFGSSPSAPAANADPTLAYGPDCINNGGAMFGGKRCASRDCCYPACREVMRAALDHEVIERILRGDHPPASADEIAAAKRDFVAAIAKAEGRT